MYIKNEMTETTKMFVSKNNKIRLAIRFSSLKHNFTTKGFLKTRNLNPNMILIKKEARGNMISSDLEIAWGLIIYGTGNDYLGLDTHRAAKTAEWSPQFFKMSYTNERAKCYWQKNVQQLFFIYKKEYLNKINLVWRDLFYSYSTKMQEKAVELKLILASHNYRYKEIFNLFNPILPYLNQPNANRRLQYDLGLCISLNYGFAKNKEETFKYCKFSADQGYAEAQFKIGEILEYAANRNSKEVLKYYLLSADQGHSKAQYHVGRIFERGLEKDILKDMDRAIHYYKLAANQKNDLGLCSLINIYKTDDHLNLEEAFKYAKLTSNFQNDFLGFCYEEGIGGQIDLEKAFISYGGLKGLINYRVAYCHEKGIGTKVDMEKALNYYKIIADRGREDPEFLLNHEGDIKNNTHLLADIPLIIEAVFKVANCYENGIGTKLDRQLAFKYYTYLDEVMFALVAIFKLGKAYKDTLNEHQHLKNYFTYNHFQRHKFCRNDIKILTEYWFMLGQKALLKIAEFHYESAVHYHSEVSLQKSLDYYKKARNNLVLALDDVHYYETPFLGSEHELGEMFYYKQSCIRLMNQFSYNPLISL